MDIRLRKSVLAKITPSKKEHEDFSKEVSNFISILVESSKKQGFHCDFFLGGSFGKDTYLLGNFDVDVFCRFDQSKYEDKDLSNNLKAILEGAQIEYKKEKGSRDYYRIDYDNGKIKIVFELVPIFKIGKNLKAKNSTDYSPLHVEFLKKKMEENPNLGDEIRLAKQFFKAYDLYGAESYIGGFSGHVIDNLIAYYGSLENLLKGVKEHWQENFYIDPNNFYKSQSEAIKKIEEDKVSNLVLVDPILKTRNAARAVSTQKYNEFLFVANNFEKFKEEDFKIEDIDFDKEIDSARVFAKKHDLKVLIYRINFDFEGNSKDIVGSKLLKLFKKMDAYFRELDFLTIDNDFQISFKKNEAIFIYYFEREQLGKLKKIIGPKIFMANAVRNFLDKNEFVLFKIEKDRAVIFKKRDVTKLSQIKSLKISDCKIFLGKDISFLKSFKLLE